MAIKTVEQRFWAKVDSSGGPDACWPWKAAANQYGYGVFWDGERLTLATRYVYRREHPDLTSDVHVLHECDNPPCCNLKHLFPGTQASNMADKVKKGRQSKGSHRYNAKLSEDDVKTIRAVCVKGDSVFGCTALAAKYGVHPSIISEVVAGKRYVQK